MDDDELNSSSNSAELFGKIENSNHTIESTLCADDESIEQLEEYFRNIESVENDDCKQTGLGEVTVEDDSSLKLDDAFSEYEEVEDSFDSFVGLGDSLAQVNFFSPEKSQTKTNTQSESNVCNTERKLARVTFAENLTTILDESDKESHWTCEEIDVVEHNSSTWYSYEDYNALRKEIRKTMEKIARCRRRNEEFPETDGDTARGLEQVTREMILERKQYKLECRLVVYDEQEAQRVSRISDPERIREVYAKAAAKASAIALEYGRKDREAILEL